MAFTIFYLYGSDGFRPWAWSIFAFTNFRPEIAGATMGVFLLLIPIIWLIVDIIKKKSPIPLLVFIAITISAIYLDGSGHSAWWQTFAKWFVDTFFK
ncbi:MAG: hypothetical protein IPO07_30005 [Haliscomenobacter sp.]|nr:hypothetical protein [Haliscomenobacter sp.]MBK9492552.1 hypothetical protein [Haliscomenobacter sp.]